MTIIVPPAYMQNLNTHTASTDRSVMNALINGPRVANALQSSGGINMTLGAAMAITQSVTPAMTIDIGSGVCVVPGGDAASQGSYAVVNDATVTVAIAASDPTLPRIDRVIVLIRDAQFSGVNNDAIFSVLTGTPASSPVPPNVPGDALGLAQVRVNAGVTSILNAVITDGRNPITTLGGVETCLSSNKPTNGLYVGYTIWQTDIKLMAVWNGASWDSISYTVGAWTPYTPTFTNLTIGNGIFAGVKFIVNNKTCRYKGRFTWGSSTSATGSATLLSMPVAALDANGSTGSALLFDNSLAANRQSGIAFMSTTSLLQFIGSLLGGNVTGTNPFAFAVSDIIQWDIEYEIA